MPHHLQKKLSVPIEREYEAWIIQGIENYLNSLGVRYEVWAVSPQDETVWPSDQSLFVHSKLIGLQMKQAKMASGPVSTDRLKWSLHQPAGQFELIQLHSEIFYCLPTFINRDLRHSALDHCLFWRPRADRDYNVWFDNAAAKTPYKSEKNAMRWGAFYESIISCDSGIYVENESQAMERVENIRRDFYDFVYLREKNASAESHLYLFSIGLQS